MKFLIALQDCDARIEHIQIKKAEGPKKVENLQERLRAVEGTLMEASKELESRKRERRETERGIEDIENKLKKAQLKLSNIKSNKEYQAALKEINELEKDKILMEDKAIEMMEQVEDLQTRWNSSKAGAEEMERQLAMDQEALVRALKALDRSLKAVEAERIRFLREIDTDLLTRYDTIKGHKGGIAVSPVLQGVCQTCHMRIPPQEFNELIRGDKLMTCPNCLRIIYWGDDKRYQGDPEQRTTDAEPFA